MLKRKKTIDIEKRFWYITMRVEAEAKRKTKEEKRKQR